MESTPWGWGDRGGSIVTEQPPHAGPSGGRPVRVGQVPVHPLTRAETLEFLALNADPPLSTVFYANAHAVNLAARDPGFREALEAADLVFCDGKAVQWATRVLGEPVPERFTPPDWIDELCEMAVQRNARLFFLGGAEGVADRAAAKLREAHPGLEVRTHHGYFDPNSESGARACASVNAYRPHFLLVGMGMPRQELWIHRHRDRLEAGVAMAVGGMFDYVSGSLWRAPRWITDHGLEWVARLAREPRRLAARYLLGNPAFVLRIARQRLRGGGGNARS